MAFRLFEMAVKHHTEWQDLAGAALLVCAKCEESDITAVEELNSYLSSKCSSVHLLELELLQSLDWSVQVVTPLHFVHLYLSLGVVFKNDFDHSKALIRYVRKYSEFFVELCLQEQEFLKYSAEKVGCSCIGAARKALGLEPWPLTLVELTCFQENLLCIQIIWKLYIASF